MKPLLPTLKEKKRYLAFEVSSDAPVDSYQAAFLAIEESFSRFSGTKGLAQAGLMPLPADWDPKTNRGLVRVSAKSVDEAKAVLALVKEVKGKKAMMRSLGTSGMLRIVREKFLANG